MKNYIVYIFTLLMLLSCGKKEEPKNTEEASPRVTEQGELITFSSQKTSSFFQTEKVSDANVNAELAFPAKVAASVIISEESDSQNIVLFDDPDLAGNYSQLTQHLININRIKNSAIRQKKIELARVKDLKEHGAATGKDLLEAQTELVSEETNLYNEKAALIEHESQLKSGGFDSDALRVAKAGTIYIICDVPENQVGEIKEGAKCIVQFNSFPNQTFNGKIEEIADVVDNVTRMIKVRIIMDNIEKKIKAGMFAIVSFGVSENNNYSVDKNSLITIQGKDYVFVKTSDSTFKRKQVTIGPQIKDRIIVYKGLNQNEEVAVKGVMQLKGLSFGY